MAYIIKKKIKTYTYYYLVESQRVNGKSKFVWQKCLGTADKIKNFYEEQDNNLKIKPQKVAYLEFGAIAAFYDLQKRLSMVDIFNRHCKKRKQGCSPGEYLLIKIINRCVDPKAEYALDDWYKETILPRLTGIPPKALSGQNFWDNTQYLNEEAIENIENELIKVFKDRFNLCPENILFDESNFSVYFDVTNPSELAKNGHSKSKRFDLRQINLALLVTKEFGIPLKHHTYAGNINDKTEIKGISKRIISTYKEFSKVCDKLTLVFDKGNNQSDVITDFDKEQILFVGALKPSENKELLSITLENFADLTLSKDKQYKVYSLKKDLFGKERTVVIYYSPLLYRKQLYAFEKKVSKTQEELEEFKTSLINKTKFKTSESCQKKVNRLLSDKIIQKVFDYTLTTNKDGLLCFEFSINKNEYQEKVSRLGRNILFTNSSNLSTKEIIEIYNGKNDVEEDFKTLKDDRSISTNPMFCWTDPKIVVHLFCCVMALTLIRLLQRELSFLKISMSHTQFINELKKVKETHLIYPLKSGTDRVLSECNKEQIQLIKSLGLKKYI